MNAPFKIGQKVVALETRKNGAGVKLVKGQIYTVKNLLHTKCCGTWYVDVQLAFTKHGVNLCNCGIILFSDDEIIAAWVHNYFFAPIQTNYADATAEILEKFKSPEESPDKIIIKEPINQ